MAVLLSYAFRPLFLLATLYAILAVPYWVMSWLGLVPMPVTLGTPSWWHAHEMIFGFAGAAIGGFALTAVATWTKRPPVGGVWLLSLSALWLVARLGLALPISGLLVAGTLADLSYGVLLLALMSREVLAARSERNYKVLVLLAMFVLSNALFYAGLESAASWTGGAILSGLWVVLLLINLIGGRIIPGFTRNWLKRRSTGAAQRDVALPPPFGPIDLFASCLLLLFAVLHVFGAPSAALAFAGVVASVVMFVRLTRWQGVYTGSDSLVWVLHLGFSWLPMGVLLIALAQFGLVPETAGIHALTGGALATMVVAIASRAALGHTGRPLQSTPILTAAYVLITVAAALRVAATLGPAARPLLLASAAAWLAGFLCFAWRYVPILVMPRERPKGALPTV